MTPGPPIPPLPDAHTASHRSAAIRSGLVVLAWLSTWPMRAHGAPWRFALDLGLMAMGWWAVRPGRQAGGKLFGEDGHWTSVLVALPIGFAVAAIAEAWHMLRGTVG